jgi:putative peptide zinc metalloprotease protein
MDLVARDRQLGAPQALGLDAVSAGGQQAGAQQEMLSGSWYRVADLRPRLRTHVRISRHEYRGERWYVLADRLSRRSHRLNAAAWFLAGLLNGRRRMQEIWDAAVERFGDDAPTQDDAIRLLGQLHSADLLQCDVTPDVDELLRRSHRIAQRGFVGKLLSPLAIKIPLYDPDRLLERWLPWIQPLFGRFGLALWLAVVGWGAVLGAQHWNELTRDLGHSVLAPDNLLILVLVFPLVKAIHEFGHACAVKAWGGEVHEMGVMLLVLMPVPYVDASASSAFPQKSRRAIVGAAGMLVELFVAALCLMLWLEMQPGVLRAVLFNAMLIAGVSTVLFNANPLLRFDGYYILSDLVEIPNLRQRASQYAASLFQRHLFGMPLSPFEGGAREKALLLTFLVLSFVYRISVTLAIALFISGAYFYVGLVLALWAAASATVLPLVGLVSYLAFNPRLGPYRKRAIITSSLLAGVLAVLLFVVPVSSWTNAQGVVSIPEQSMVRASADGFVTRVLVAPDGAVRRGEPLVETADRAAAARLRSLEAQQAELEARYQAESADNNSKVRAQMTFDQLRHNAAELQRARDRSRDLVLRSPADGKFALSSGDDLPGRYLRQGEAIGHVVADSRLTARVVVPQQAVDLVRGRTGGVSIKLAERVDQTYPSRILREVPRASDRLPSAVLTQAGGGEAALDPRSSEPKAMQTYFEFEVELPQDQPFRLGGRAYVRFDHGAESVSAQVWRWLRQLFLLRLAM